MRRQGGGRSGMVIPAGSVVSAEVRQFPLFCNLRVTLRDGRVLLFKEMPREHADGLKNALGAAGGGGRRWGKAEPQIGVKKRQGNDIVKRHCRRINDSLLKSHKTRL